MATHSVGVADFGDELGACVFELPGCATLAPDIGGLGELIPPAISEHLVWLGRHGIGAPSSGTVEFEIVERTAAADVAAADGEFCFAHDSAATTHREIEDALRVMSASRHDLTALIAGVPGTVADWRPPPSVLRVIHEWAPEVRTIAQIIQHVATSDFYYRNRLTDSPEEPGPAPELNDLDLQRNRTVERLLSLKLEEMSRTFRPQRPWQDRPEEWTARKVLRRIIEHERFHTAEIQQRLTWLRLGLPGR